MENKKFKVLYVARLFSGLEKSFIDRQWTPTGVPTIYKFIEALNQQDWKIKYIFTQKDGHSEWTEKKDKEIKLKEFSSPFDVLSGEQKFTSIFGLRFQKLCRELQHCFYILKSVVLFKPDLIYIDHANTITAAILARFFKIKVIYRVMGIYPFMRDVLVKNSAKYVFFRWCYRSPFEAIVCTEDGTGIEAWLSQAINPNSPRFSMINGVHLEDFEKEKLSDEILKVFQQKKTVILYLGKLEDHKGCIEFIQGFKKACKETNGQICAIVVGFGSQKSELLKFIRENELDGVVTIVDRLPHSKILKLQSLCDIYVSLNKLGNLSNANLEAMLMGQCIILPESLPYLGKDLLIEKYFSPRAMKRIPTVFDTSSLAEAIAELHHNPESRARMREEVKESSKAFIPTWNNRIKNEIKLLEKVFND